MSKRLETLVGSSLVISGITVGGIEAQNLSSPDTFSGHATRHGHHSAHHHKAVSIAPAHTTSLEESFSNELIGIGAGAAAGIAATLILKSTAELVIDRLRLRANS